MGIASEKHRGQITEESFKIMLAKLDADGNGKVTKDEFSVPYRKMRPELSNADFEDIWRDIDVDNSGTLSLGELEAFYGFNDGMSDDQIMEMLMLQTQMQELEMETERRRRGEPESVKSKRNSRGIDGKYRPSILTDTERRSCGVSPCKLSAQKLGEDESVGVKFLVACELEDLATIEAMLETKINVRVEDEKGEMALHKLARMKNISRTKLIKAVMALSSVKRTDLDWQDKKGRTPLMFAAEFNHCETVSLFLNCGADALLQDEHGGTALHHAVIGKSLDTIKELLGHSNVPRKELIDMADNSRRSALHLASFNALEEMTQVLIDYGASPFTDSFGNKPSMLAGKAGRRNSRENLLALEGSLRGE